MIQHAGILLSALLPVLPWGGAAGDGAGLIRSGDEAFARIDYPGAIALYEEALTGNPGDTGALWRVARACVCEAEISEGDVRARVLADGEKYARRCIAADSTRAEGHTWLAGALGYIALDAGTERKLAISRELMREALRATELDPGDDAAWSILGSFYRALGNIGWLERALASVFVGSVPRGGYEEAESALKKSIAIAPDIMRHRYELGILYIDMGRKEEARQALEAAAALPVRTGIDRPRLLKIRELLAGPDFR
jgi:tetratricopeptide (TPR) repeat protein